MVETVHNCDEYCVGYHEKVDDSPVGKLLRGAIDTHLHFSPDSMPRRFNAFESALRAREAGLRGIVIKNHTYPTAPLAGMVSDLVPDVAVIGGVCLEYEAGGVNPHAVEMSARHGGKIVWMPVFCSANSRVLVHSKLGLDIPGNGLSILDKDGKLVPEIDEILKIIKEYNMTLATGHISAPEVLALVDRAKLAGVTKIVVTHAMSDFLSESILTPEERQTLAKEGVLIEHCAWQISPTGGMTDPSVVAESINREGPQNCIMSTDSGGVPHPVMTEALRMFIAAMLKCGLSEEDITYMVKINPARVVGLPTEE
jgi:hypothetical protein